MQMKENGAVVCSLLTSVINLALILCQPIPPPTVNTSLFHTAIPKWIVIFFCAQLCRTRRTLLMQNVELHPAKMKIWHSKWHLCVCACRFPLSAVDWQLVSLRFFFFLFCEGRPDLQEGHFFVFSYFLLFCPGTSLDESLRHARL